MVDLASLSLFRGTREQFTESARRSADEWARGLSVEQYIARDVVLESNEHANNGKLIVWVLAPRDDPTTLDFMCSCETFRRTVAVGSPSSPSGSTAVGYGVASVFTPAHKRGKGYARHMMRLLHWVLAPHTSLPTFPPEWGLPPSKETALGDATVSVLYSDVGQFYQACGPSPDEVGWVIDHPVSTEWTVPQTQQTGVDAKWKGLTKADCLALWTEDAELMARDVAAAAQTSGKPTFSYLPDKGLAQFVVERRMQFTPEMKPVYPPEPWGVQLVENGVPLTYATWTSEPGTKTMVLIRVRASAGVVPELFDVVRKKAQELGFDKIEAWNACPDLAKVADGRTFERKDHLSAVKWYNKAGPTDQVQWLFNEKFCWC